MVRKAEIWTSALPKPHGHDWCLPTTAALQIADEPRVALQATLQTARSSAFGVERSSTSVASTRWAMSGRRPDCKKNLMHCCGRVQVMSPACSRGTRPLALMLSADRNPIKSPGSTPMAHCSGSSELQIDRFASHHHHPRNLKILYGGASTTPCQAHYGRAPRT